jgi:hypothetical protein
MTAAPHRTTLAQALAGRDDDHERELVAAIITAIADVARVTDANAIAIRTGETASALTSVLATVLAMSPQAARSPTAIRATVDALGKRLRRRLAAAERDPLTQDFLHRVFRDGDVGGSA